MRLKSVNKNSLNSARNTHSHETNKNGIGFSILNNDLQNVDENSFDLDMDSGEDEIDVGTHTDSLLINYNNLNNSETYSAFPTNSSASTIASVNDNSQFGLNSHSQANNLDQAENSFVIPQQTAVMSEADRKRAHHNALERKRRDHIKDSFHTLRDAIPNIKGEKVSTSRAQILKAATDYIKTMKNRNTVYQNDIDLIKKQNQDIENQIRQLEKSKLNNQCVNSNIIIKTEQPHSVSSTPNHIQLNDNSDDNNDFKFEFTESLAQTQPNNIIHGNNPSGSNILKANNVLILTKPSANGSTGPTTTSKKFKTIVNTKTSLINNGNFL